MRKKRLKGVLAVAALAALLFILLVGVFWSQIWKRDIPSVILITISGLDPGLLGLYAYDKEITPNIDGIAYDGVVFEDCISPIPFFTSTHISIMTGISRSKRGGPGQKWPFFDRKEKTLAQIFKKHGYATAAIIGTRALDSSFDFEAGFKNYEDQDPEFKGQPSSVDNLAKKPRFLKRRADFVNEGIFKWLDQNTDPAFFLWINYSDLNLPIDLPFVYQEVFKEDLYEGQIVFLDEQLGLLLSDIKNRGLYERALIVMVSDHGFIGEDHAEKGKALSAQDQDSKNKILLIIKPPIGSGVYEARISSQVRAIDIFPTILELSGIGARRGQNGKSLVELMRGE